MALLSSLPPVAIAVLEPIALVADALVRLLPAEGFRVAVQAADPEALVAGVIATPVRLAVMEVAAAGASIASEEAFAAIGQLRSWSPEVKVVVLSGAPDETLSHRSYEASAAAFLDKRTTPVPHLAAVLRRVQAGERIFEASRFAAASPPPTAASPLARLTSRECQVLRCLSSGADNLKISAALEISERTVRAHVSALYRKLGAENRTELALLARSLGVTPQPSATAAAPAIALPG